MTTSSDPLRPTFRQMICSPSLIVAQGFGSGLAPFAPGTFGSLLAWLLFPLLAALMPDPLFLLVLLVFFTGGVLVCHYAGAVLGKTDHGSIVWDEMVAVWLVLLMTPSFLLWQALAVILFRLFDILKPWPVHWADKRFKNGFGVMFDDLIAALYAIFVLAICVRIARYTGWTWMWH